MTSYHYLGCLVNIVLITSLISVYLSIISIVVTFIITFKNYAFSIWLICLHTIIDKNIVHCHHVTNYTSPLSSSSLNHHNNNGFLYVITSFNIIYLIFVLNHKTKASKYSHFFLINKFTRTKQNAKLLVINIFDEFYTCMYVY